MQPQTAATTRKQAKVPVKKGKQENNLPVKVISVANDLAMGAERTIQSIDLSLIEPNPYNVRHNHDEQALRELAESINRFGVLHPITVRHIGERYQIVCGERRFMASMVAERQDIPAMVGEFTDLQMMEIALVENIQRRNFTHMEEAELFGR